MKKKLKNRDALIEDALDYEVLTNAAEDGERAAQIILEIADYDRSKVDWLVRTFCHVSREVWELGDLSPEHRRWEVARKFCLDLPETGLLARHQPAARAFLAWLDEVLARPH
jgi:hypothetical protein